MKAKKQKTKQDQDQPVNGTWMPIPEREALPNVKKGKEIISYFLQMYKNNTHTAPCDFCFYPSNTNLREFNAFLYRNASIFAFFCRDLKLTNKHAYTELTAIMKLPQNIIEFIEPARTGRVTGRMMRITHPLAMFATAFFLGFSSVFAFLEFLESVYSIPYQRMMAGEKVKHGQPWFCLNYEDGTSGQGRNDDEEGNISDI